MSLHDLKPRPGSKHRRKLLGHGESSGHGKTSGRGGKGQTARSGSSIRIGFEGGQMPLIRRMPKRGFNNAQFAVRYIPVNLDVLNKFEDGATVDEAALRSLGLANGPEKLVKILGDGELTRKLTIKAHAFSVTARAKIEKLGGACELVPSSLIPKPEPKKPARPPKPQPAKTEDKPPAKPEGKEKDKTKPAKKEGKPASKESSKPADKPAQ